jgi:uncharacterized membrane protein
MGIGMIQPIAGPEEYYKEKYKNKYMISHREMVVKIAILRIVSSIITAGIVYYLTGSLETSVKIMWIDFLIKTIVYMMYEYGWLKLRKNWSDDTLKGE